MNTDEKLAYMANQIARNFAGQCQGVDDAIAATADHIARFWDPGMRARIRSRLETLNNGLEPVAEAAVRALGPSHA